MFGNKEQKLKEQEKREAINDMFVSTLPTCHRKFEALGIVTSSMDDGDVSFSIFMDEIKKEAYHIGADAVIGITFQTGSASENYGSGYHERKVIKSRVVGTAIKYID